jgi:phosphopantothenate-cysteine ligase
MRILITAGGTRAPIDEVRWVGNVSTGRFGSELARHCLVRGVEVVHLHARNAEVPYLRTIDLREDWKTQLEECRQSAAEFDAVRDRYRSIPFMELEDYARELERLLTTEPFDVVFLTAAVSDYAPIPRVGKISSRSGELVVHMAQVPKLIAKVKDWAPDVFLVGFKLLAGASEEELIRTAVAAGKVNRADVTVANDLRLLRQGNHTIHLVRDGKPTETFPATADPAQRLVERVLKWSRERTPAVGASP